MKKKINKIRIPVFKINTQKKFQYLLNKDQNRRHEDDYRAQRLNKHQM